MTDSVDRLATPTRASDWLALVARTDGPTDGLTKMDSPSDESSSNATPAGGQDDFTYPDEIEHDHKPHVYVIYWPDHAIIKVGITENQDRWEWWTRHGAVLIALTDTCCMDHARKIEARMLGHLARYGSRAFKSEQEARFALGKKRGGYTECYRLVQSPRYGDAPDHEYDWERAYGLILPREFEADFHTFTFGPFPIHPNWRQAASA